MSIMSMQVGPLRVAAASARAGLRKFSFWNFNDSDDTPKQQPWGGVCGSKWQRMIATAIAQFRADQRQDRIAKFQNCAVRRLRGVTLRVSQHRRKMGDKQKGYYSIHITEYNTPFIKPSPRLSWWHIEHCRWCMCMQLNSMRSLLLWRFPDPVRISFAGQTLVSAFTSIAMVAQ